MSSMSRSQARTMRRIWFTSPLLLPEAATGHRGDTWKTPSFLVFQSSVLVRQFWWLSHSFQTCHLGVINKIPGFGMEMIEKARSQIWQNPPGTCCGPKKRQPVSQFAERPRRSFNSPTSYFSWSKSWPRHHWRWRCLGVRGPNMTGCLQRKTQTMTKKKIMTQELDGFADLSKWPKKLGGIALRAPITGFNP